MAQSDQEPHTGDTEVAPGEIEISLVGMVNTVLRHRWLVVGMAATLGVLAVVFVLVRHRDWTARAVFRPEGVSVSSNMSGLAAQFGVNLGGSGNGEPLEFYVELLRSREVREAAILSEYRFVTGEEAGDTLSGTYTEIFEIDRETPRKTMYTARRHLNRNISVTADAQAGVIFLDVTTPWQELSEQLTARLLELINDYNLQRRQSQAAAERAFVEERLAEAREELGEAEEDLKIFLERNKRYEDSQELQFEARRLQRRVDLRGSVYSSLAQNFEQARIDQVRNTPVISVVDPPAGSARPAGMSGVSLVLLVGVFGVALGILLAFVLDFARRQRGREGDEYAEMRALWRATTRDLTLRRLGDRFRRPRGGARR